MTIFVENLPLEATEDDVRKAFEVYAEVQSIIIIKNEYTGLSRRFGFVEIQAEGEAEQAVNLLNGMELKGRVLKLHQVP